MKGKNKWKILRIVCLAGVLVSVGILLGSYFIKKNSQRKLQELAEQTNVTVTEIQGEPVGGGMETNSDGGTENPSVEEELSVEEKRLLLQEELGIEIPEKNLDFAKLQEETNADIYAWIAMPDTKIDYPVLQHPENNAYYLYYNLDGTKGYPGCIYTENYNKKDFSDHNTVLYGHNMKDGTMFQGLHKYSDSTFLEEHPYVFVYTEDDIFVYRIFAAYEFSNIHLLKGYDTDSDTGFEWYLKDVQENRSMNSNVAQDVEVTSDDRIITLSTCIANKPDNRFLVQGVLLNED